MTESDSRFRAIVIAYLESGYGAEDIAVQTGYDLVDVRQEIKDLREAGVFAKIYGTDNDRGTTQY